jgi:hypothetical protein
VREQQRHRRRSIPLGTGVDEVDTEAVDHGAEPGQPIQPLLGRTPVEAVCPVGDEVAQLRDVYPADHPIPAGASGQFVA